MNNQRIVLLKKFIQEEPSNPFNGYALAMEYYDDRSEEALTLLESLIENHQDYLPTYYKLAHLYWALENFENANEIFKNGIVLAQEQGDEKALSELNSSYLNFQFEYDE